MTSHYVDYTITLPEVQSGEISHLLGRLWQRLHGVLAADDIQHLGISLPALAAKHPGNVLRLHSDAKTLQQVKANAGMHQLAEMAGIQVGDVQPTPQYCQYRSFTRSRGGEKLTHAGFARQEARWLKRLQAQGKPITVDLILARREHFKQQRMQSLASTVYLRLNSVSTHQQFSLIIQTSVATTEPQTGKFSHYGLAVADQDKDEALATVPWFV